jgi:hypothetical protein
MQSKIIAKDKEVIMTLQQEAVQLIENMPEENIKVIIDLLHLMNPAQKNTDTKADSMKALQWIRDMHGKMPDNTNEELDIEQERQEALAEKYGSID